MTTLLTDLKPVHYGFPTPLHPCYHLVLALDPTPSRDLIARQLRVDGKRVRDFWVYTDGSPHPTSTFLANRRGQLVVRVDWSNDSQHRVELDLDDNGQIVTLATDSTAPHQGGYWNPAWRYYAGTVLRENAGIARVKEPIHILLGVYSERVTNPEKEVRVVSVDPITGAADQVPCQVYDVSTQDAVLSEKGQPTTTFQVAFLADVPAHSSRVYLTFYGNATADAPRYATDLSVIGQALALTIENTYYRIKLHPRSGAVDEVLLKQGVNAVFDHHVETNGALFWNPDLYAPPRVWTHASDWAPPQNCQMLSGPVFFMLKRWGPLPDYPDVECSVTYLFHAHQPYMLMDSNLDILQDIDVRAMRNGELVVNLNVAREFAWKHADGQIGTVAFSERPREPRRAVDLPGNTPWWAFFNRDQCAALAALTLETAAVRRRQGLVHIEPTVILKWGPWAYCVRILVQTNNSSNPQRLIRVPGGSSYSERMAIYPCRLGVRDQDRFAPIDLAYEQLSKPLQAAPAELDLDERVPEAWGPTFPAPGSRLSEKGDL